MLGTTDTFLVLVRGRKFKGPIHIVTGSESSRERKFQGTKVPCNFRSWERKFQVTNVPGNKSSRERKYEGAMVLSLLGVKVRGDESSIIRPKRTLRINGINGGATSCNRID